MWVWRRLQHQNTKKTISVCLCFLFIVFCVLLITTGFKWPHVWAVVYSMETSQTIGVTIMYLFTSSLLVINVFLLLALKQNGPKSILCCLLALLFLWQMHLVACFLSITVHTMNLKEESRTVVALYKTLPLLSVQGLWLYFISVTWYYWRELTLAKDVPAFVISLRFNSRRQKAMRQDQRDRLGDLPRRFMSQLITKGINLADAS
ncbi:uncharacterized protein [Onthophagus taurus]|uniref:uncharacterized protein n=1 Tax=Onthophagus taurus TaxID=166361 RepID=UPI000C200653|nr:uncharacterized protein LOC111424453 [Onthophagus taurus]